MESLLWSDNRVENFLHEINLISDYSKEDSLRIYYRYMWLINDLKRMIYYEKINPEKCIVYDELIFQRVISFLVSIRYDRIDKYIPVILSEMPKPKGVIFLYDEPSDIFSRLMEREKSKHKIMPGFRGICDNEILNKIHEQDAIIRKCISQIKEYGTDVRELSFYQAINEKSEQTFDYLNDFSKS